MITMKGMGGDEECICMVLFTKLLSPLFMQVNLKREKRLLSLSIKTEEALQATGI